GRRPPVALDPAGCRHRRPGYPAYRHPGPRTGRGAAGRSPDRIPERAIRRAGFTLVEMLVALLVFGLLAAAGAAVMGSALTSQSAVKSRVERFADFQRLRAVLRADLAQAAGRRTRDSSGQPAQVAFIGG